MYVLVPIETVVQPKCYYWYSMYVYAHVQVKLQSSRLSLNWTRDGVFDHEVIHVFLRLVQDHREARVVGVAEKPRTKAPPPALHTVELLRMASSKLHIGPKQTMDMAERLYISVSVCVCVLVCVCVCVYI